MADDLARAIIDQLKVDDGPCPLALTYSHLDRHSGRIDRWLVLKAKRVNGRVVYEACVAASSTYYPAWSVVTYENPKAAAALAFAFLEQPHLTGNPLTDLERKKGHQLKLVEVDAHKWKYAEGTQTFKECFHNVYGTFTVTGPSDIEDALRTLVPVSVHTKQWGND
tara:strand:+ start:667 stop:1164 length:498 start_codon:yes stop_codon:yes gene_type:complete